MKWSDYIPESIKVKLRGAVWGLLISALSAIAEALKDTYPHVSVFILMGLIPFLTYLGKTTPTSKLLPGTPTNRASDPLDENYKIDRS